MATQSIKSFFSLLREAIAGKEIDLTQASIKKAIFLLAVPMILEMSMESIFALVDIFYVSQVSTNAVATIGLTESVITLVYALAVGLSMAATAIVARRIGEKDPEGAKRVTVQVIFLGVLVSLIVGVIGIVFPKEILGLMGGDQSLIEEGYRYTQILIGGNCTIVLLFLINAVYRGAGNASMAMWTLILSNGINIILDPIFIFGWGPIPEYGVAGAAIATTIGRGTAVLFQLYILFYGSTRVRLALKDFVVNIGVMINLIRVSVGGIGQFIIGTSSWIFLMRIISEFGSEVLAGYTIAIRVIMFTMMPAWGLSNAAATLVGQNLGANQPERAETSVWKTAKYNAFFMVSVSVIYLLFAKTIVGWFSVDPEVLKYGALSLQIVTIAYFLFAYGMTVTMAFNGAGDTRTPTIINFFCFWVFQLPFAYFTALVLDWGPTGVFLAIALAESLIAIIAIIWFKKGKWKLIKV
ncbi:MULTISPECIES: MATE family efflux transporter [Aequorivita]|uniref:Multidrug-efflux transporter n=1 Tax=Aequorivita iocasae TaxID=2803865 RepID=A0ABX7DP16_9FLAO|nr:MULTISPECIES: MATE family efflux transporter [Aequorivita]QQX75301.1 MATE family efflux transporter [Aequorivita iocasae]UCA54750.1 MATE family efflux transporter [Aequorivita sp. F7]